MAADDPPVFLVLLDALLLLLALWLYRQRIAQRLRRLRPRRVTCCACCPYARELASYRARSGVVTRREHEQMHALRWARRRE